MNKLTAKDFSHLSTSALSLDRMMEIAADIANAHAERVRLDQIQMDAGKIGLHSFFLRQGEGETAVCYSRELETDILSQVVTPTPRWCEHIFWLVTPSGKNGCFWTRNKDYLPSVFAPDYWTHCPRCGAPRPTKGSPQ